jgi:hypothetical protein
MIPKTGTVMNKQPQNKILILIIGILLLANIATLSFFMMKTSDKPKTARLDKKAMISSFLQQEVGFTKEQMNRYDTMSKQLGNHLAQQRTGFKKLASMVTDSAIQFAAGDISNQQKGFECLLYPSTKNVGFIRLFQSGGREKK